MAGAVPYYYDESMQSSQGVGAVSPRQSTPMSFIVWLAIIGVVIPVLLLGGLKVGGFSFVFRNRG